MNTAGAFYADSSHQGGLIFKDAFGITVLLAGATSTNFAISRAAVGKYSQARTAGGAETYQAVVGLGELKRLIEVANSPLPWQVQFGTASGTAGWPAGQPGIPGQTVPSYGLGMTPPTGAPPKGIEIVDVFAIYQVGVANLTSASLSLNRTVFANNTALVVTNIPVASTALPLTAAGDGTGPYVVTRAVTSTLAFETTDLSDVALELDFVMANTGTMNIYGMGFHVNFNYD